MLIKKYDINFNNCIIHKIDFKYDYIKYIIVKRISRQVLKSKL